MSWGDQIIVLSNLIVAAAAALALFVGWRQIGMSRELSAIEAYENYHVLCLQYPHFSTGRIAFEELGIEELDSYTVFVLYTLMTGERIFSLFPKDKGWIFSIEEDVRIHRRFISSPYFAYHLKYQDWKIKPVIDRVLSEPEDESASHGWAQSIALHKQAAAMVEMPLGRRRSTRPRRTGSRAGDGRRGKD